MPVERKATPALKKSAIPAKALGKKPLPGLVKRVSPLDSLSLPEEASTPSESLLDYSWLIYGERKIGKTTLLSMFGERPLFLMFEAGAKGLSIFKREVANWKEFETYIGLLEKNPTKYDLIVIDTGGECYEQNLLQVKKDFNLVDIRDKAWGGGYTESRQRFGQIHDRLYRLPCGFGVTAHSEIKTIKPKFGSEYDKLTIQLPGQAFKYYLGVVDNIAYYHYDENGKRILTIRGDETVEAGTRCEGRFLYPDGEPIKDIPMGDTKEEAFANLTAAFNNTLPKPLRAAKKRGE